MFYDLIVPFFVQVNKTDRYSCSCTTTMQQNQPDSTSCSSSALSSVSGTEQRRVIQSIVVSYVKSITQLDIFSSLFVLSST